MNPKTIALLGPANIGRTNLVRMFMRHIEEGKVPARILRTDFSGESILPYGERETKTITPNKVFFTDENGAPYLLIAPGGETDRPVVKMGVINSVRLARAVIAVFDLSQDLQAQFAYFNSLKIFLKQIYICLTKCDLVLEHERSERIVSYAGEITSFFAQYGIQVNRIACAGEFSEEEDENANAGIDDVILEAAHNC